MDANFRTSSIFTPNESHRTRAGREKEKKVSPVLVSKKRLSRPDNWQWGGRLGGTELEERKHKEGGACQCFWGKRGSRELKGEVCCEEDSSSYSPTIPINWSVCSTEV